jgi:hypothetical protein
MGIVLWQYGRIRSIICGIFFYGVGQRTIVVFTRKKKRLLALIDRLDVQAETTPLNNFESKELREAHEVLAKLRRDEEIKWAQRAKVKLIQEEGNNTKYFHLVANGKHRRKKIFQIEQDEGTIIGQENIKDYISNFYKKLFGPPIPSSFQMDESVTYDIPQVSHEENTFLSTDFTEKEVFEAIMQMKKNKAPELDGFPVEFCQSFWQIIKIDLMRLFEAFQHGDLLLFHLNYGIIVLLPKKEDATQIQQYMPIFLLNVIFNFLQR